MNLMIAKEHIQSLEHSIFKIQANGHSNDKELVNFAHMKTKREDELI
jgi:uncharacterized protein YigA (DUF484 family)